MVRLLLGSNSDIINGNILLSVFLELGIECKVSIISCHRHKGEFDDFIRDMDEMDEGIIIFLGGMNLAAPGVIRSIFTAASVMGKTVFAIPTDIAARSAIEDLPEGVSVITSGLNTINVKHGIKNSALAIAHMIVTFNRDSPIRKKLLEWYDKLKIEKPFIPKIELKNGLIPIPEKKEA